MVNLDDAKQDPAHHFKKPADVLSDESLTRHDKIDILRRWAYDEREMAVAEEENMMASGTDNKENILDEILRCLLILGVDRDQNNPPTKQG